MIKFIKNFLKEHQELKHFIIYGFIGGFSALVDTLTYILLSKYINLDILIINIISVNVGITISFILNAFINFKMTDHLLKRALKFYAVGYIGLGISELILYIFVTVLGFNEILIKLISVVFVACVQFVLNRLLTFKKEDK